MTRWLSWLVALAGCDQVFGDSRPFDAGIDGAVADVSYEAMAAECFKDDFSIDTIGTRWLVAEPGHEWIHLAVSDGTLAIEYAAQTPANARNAIGSASVYDLRGSGYVTGKLAALPEYPTQTGFYITSTTHAPAAAYAVGIANFSSYNLVTYYDPQNNSLVSFVLGDERYFRLRPEIGKLIYEASADGSVWTHPYSLLTDDTFDGVAVIIVGGVAVAEQAGSTTRWDDIRIKTPNCDPPM